MSSCSSGKSLVAEYEIIPLPEIIGLTHEEPFLLSKKSVIVAPEELKREAEFLKEYVALQNEIDLKIGSSEDGRIELSINDKIALEGWKMEVTAESLKIEGGSAAGVFYGIQALRKMLPAEPCSEVTMQSGVISDTPRFGYRGMHFDVARHYFDKEFVKRYIDNLALHGINNFHWHLSDDQGWRIEIKRYPLLTELSAERKRTTIGRNSGEFDETPYGKGCFFTQDDAREIVAYAAERHINIIPEIDMPGHMVAALHAYPELGCSGGPYEVWPLWGVSEEVLCAGNDLTVQFAKDVLAEIVDIFPSKYIHIGGDECPKVEWEKCPKCQARIKALGLDRNSKFKPEEVLQGWFMHEMSDFLKSRGRTAIGWDELLLSDFTGDEIVVMSWQGEAGGIEAAKRGVRSIMVPQTYLYLDHYQTESREGEPLALGGCNTLTKVYHYDPTGKIPEEQREYILGVQANLWTEYIIEEDHVFHMLFPRMAALNEIQWCSPENKDYDYFKQRLMRTLKLYERLGYNYSTYFMNE